MTEEEVKQLLEDRRTTNDSITKNLKKLIRMTDEKPSSFGIFVQNKYRLDEQFDQTMGILSSYHRNEPVLTADGSMTRFEAVQQENAGYSQLAACYNRFGEETIDLVDPENKEKCEKLVEKGKSLLDHYNTLGLLASMGLEDKILEHSKTEDPLCKEAIMGKSVMLREKVKNWNNRANNKLAAKNQRKTGITSIQNKNKQQNQDPKIKL